MPTPIKLEQVVLNSHYLLVASSGTAWVNEYAHPCQVDDVIALFNKIMSYAREKGIKTNGSRSLKTSLMSFREEAKAQEARREALFDELKAGWENKVKKGLTSPAVDDLEIQALNNLVSERHALLYGKSGRERTSLRFFIAQRERLSELWRHLESNTSADRFKVLNF